MWPHGHDLHGRPVRPSPAGNFTLYSPQGTGTGGASDSHVITTVQGLRCSGTGPLGHPWYP
jgi:hypothetical protein